MGVDAADFDNSGRAGPRDHQLRQRDDRPLPRARLAALYRGRRDRRPASAPRRATRSASAACSPIVDLDGRSISSSPTATSTTPCGTSAGNVGYAQPPHLFLNQGSGTFRDVAAAAGEGFAPPRSAAASPCGDFDRDGDVDLLITTNNGPAVAVPQRSARRATAAVRFRLVGARSRTATRSARSSASSTTATSQSRMVKSGSSYLSQSELPVTFGVGTRDRVDRVVVEWPSGKHRGVQGAGVRESLRRDGRQGHRPMTNRRTPRAGLRQTCRTAPIADPRLATGSAARRPWNNPTGTTCRHSCRSHWCPRTCREWRQ